MTGQPGRRKRGFLGHSINVDPIGEYEHGEIDTVPMIVEILHAKGFVAPTAGNLVTFFVYGAAVSAGVGNRDPGSHDSIRLIDIG